MIFKYKKLIEVNSGASGVGGAVADPDEQANIDEWTGQVEELEASADGIITENEFSEVVDSLLGNAGLSGSDMKDLFDALATSDASANGAKTISLDKLISFLAQLDQDNDNSIDSDEMDTLRKEEGGKLDAEKVRTTAEGTDTGGGDDSSDDGSGSPMPSDDEVEII